MRQYYELKIVISLLVLGVIFAFGGWYSWTLARDAAKDPLAVTLEDLRNSDPQTLNTPVRVELSHQGQRFPICAIVESDESPSNSGDNQTDSEVGFMGYVFLAYENGASATERLSSHPEQGASQSEEPNQTTQPVWFVHGSTATNPESIGAVLLVPFIPRGLDMRDVLFAQDLQCDLLGYLSESESISATFPELDPTQCWMLRIGWHEEPFWHAYGFFAVSCACWAGLGYQLLTLSYTLRTAWMAFWMIAGLVAGGLAAWHL